MTSSEVTVSIQKPKNLLPLTQIASTRSLKVPSVWYGCELKAVLEPPKTSIVSHVDSLQPLTYNYTFSFPLNSNLVYIFEGGIGDASTVGELEVVNDFEDGITFIRGNTSQYLGKGTFFKIQTFVGEELRFIFPGGGYTYIVTRGESKIVLTSSGIQAS